MANMQSSNQPSKPEAPTVEPSAPTPPESEQDEDELEITVKKLDTAVRPRGVLADG